MKIKKSFKNKEIKWSISNNIVKNAIIIAVVVVNKWNFTPIKPNINAIKKCVVGNVIFIGNVRFKSVLYTY